jgi:hypothetical protein
MFPTLPRAQEIARQRAQEHDCIYFVIHVDQDDHGEAGFAVVDLETLEDFYHASDDEILFATA